MMASSKFDSTAKYYLFGSRIFDYLVDAEPWRSFWAFEHLDLRGMMKVYFDKSIIPMLESDDEDYTYKMYKELFPVNCILKQMKRMEIKLIAEERSEKEITMFLKKKFDFENQLMNFHKILKDNSKSSGSRDLDIQMHYHTLLLQWNNFERELQAPPQWGLWKNSFDPTRMLMDNKPPPGFESVSPVPYLDFLESFDNSSMLSGKFRPAAADFRVGDSSYTGIKNQHESHPRRLHSTNQAHAGLIGLNFSLQEFLTNNKENENNQKEVCPHLAFQSDLLNTSSENRSINLNYLNSTEENVEFQRTDSLCPPSFELEDDIFKMLTQRSEILNTNSEQVNGLDSDGRDFLEMQTRLENLDEKRAIRARWLRNLPELKFDVELEDGGGDFIDEQSHQYESLDLETQSSHSHDYENGDSGIEDVQTHDSFGDDKMECYNGEYNNHNHVNNEACQLFLNKEEKSDVKLQQQGEPIADDEVHEPEKQENGTEIDGTESQLLTQDPENPSTSPANKPKIEKKLKNLVVWDPLKERERSHWEESAEDVKRREEEKLRKKLEEEKFHKLRRKNGKMRKEFRVELSKRHQEAYVAKIKESQAAKESSKGSESSAPNRQEVVKVGKVRLRSECQQEPGPSNAGEDNVSVCSAAAAADSADRRSKCGKGKHYTSTQLKKRNLDPRRQNKKK